MNFARAPILACLLCLSLLALPDMWLPGSIAYANTPAASTERSTAPLAPLSDPLQPFQVRQPDHPFEGMLRRSANAGLDWYFTSLALVLAPESSLLGQKTHFEKALRLLPVAGPMPLRPAPGLRRISAHAQLWELLLTVDDPYTWQCAFVDYPAGAPTGQLWFDRCGRLWRNWGRVSADAHWSLLDTTDDFSALRLPDAHDSQAAVFLLALSKWLRLTQDWDWLRQVVWQVPGPDNRSAAVSITRADLMKLMVRHNLLNHMQGGLFRTFRHNRHPAGGIWDVQYLMDNIECHAALKALIPVFEAAGHSAFAAVMQRYEQDLADGIAALKSANPLAPAGYLRWARQGDWPGDIHALRFYPHVAGQYWEALFSLPGEASTGSARWSDHWRRMEPHLGPYSDWWRHADLHLDAGLAPYLARMQHMPGAKADVSPRLLAHARQLTPQNSVISDYVVAWRLLNDQP